MAGKGKPPGKGLQTTGESTEPHELAPYKIPQPHGGSINSGSTRGNKGGRPPSAIKSTARMMLDKRLPVINRMFGTKSVRDADKIRAFDALARVAMEPGISVADVRAALNATALEIHECPSLTTDAANELIARIETHWLKL